MRKGAKLMLSLPWVISLFEVTQLANILWPHDPHQPLGKVVASFDAVMRAIKARLNDVLQSTFQVGDRLYRGFGGRAV